MLKEMLNALGYKENDLTFNSKIFVTGDVHSSPVFEYRDFKIPTRRNRLSHLEMLILTGIGFGNPMRRAVTIHKNIACPNFAISNIFFIGNSIVFRVTDKESHIYRHDRYVITIGCKSKGTKTVMQRNGVTKHLDNTHLNITIVYTFHSPSSCNYVHTAVAIQLDSIQVSVTADL